MKRALRTGMFFGVPFGLVLGLAYSPDHSTGASILVGLIAAVGTVIGVAGYAAWRAHAFTRWAAEIYEPYEDEGIVHHGYAVLGSNLLAIAAIAIVGGRGARLDQGGVLVLTKQRLFFVPHKTNRFGKERGVALSDIVGVRPAPYFGASTITLLTRAQQSVDIKVQERAKWLAKLAAIGVTVIDPARKAP
ncbi:MAG TPA: hypothetical protein VIV40_12350 [Kofleriaceae bacterium]